MARGRREHEAGEGMGGKPGHQGRDLREQQDEGAARNAIASTRQPALDRRPGDSAGNFTAGGVAKEGAGHPRRDSEHRKSQQGDQPADREVEAERHAHHSRRGDGQIQAQRRGDRGERRVGARATQRERTRERKTRFLRAGRKTNRSHARRSFQLHAEEIIPDRVGRVQELVR